MLSLPQSEPEINQFKKMVLMFSFRLIHEKNVFVVSDPEKNYGIFARFV